MSEENQWEELPSGVQLVNEELGTTVVASPYGINIDIGLENADINDVAVIIMMLERAMAIMDSEDGVMFEEETDDTKS